MYISHFMIIMANSIGIRPILLLFSRHILIRIGFLLSGHVVTIDQLWKTKQEQGKDKDDFRSTLTTA